MGAFTLSEVHRLFPGVSERTYNQGQIVIYDGDQPRHVVYVASGAYKFYDIDQNGNEKILYIGGSGSLFPIFYTFEEKPHVDAFYATLCRSKLLLIPLKEFRETLQKDAAICSQILTWYAGQMDHTISRLKSMEKSMARHKVLEALMYLCKQPEIVLSIGAGWYRVIFPLSQQTLADLTGLTRETVNATLKEIEELKIIRSPRKVVIEINRKNLEEALAI